jgi:hypothetical protein
MKKIPKEDELHSESKKRQKKDPTAPAEPSALLAEKLSSLTVDERTEAFEDVHGVSEPIEETPEFLSRKLKELDQALSDIPEPQKEAYAMALLINSELVTHQDFRLKFLRAASFDSVNAAKRLTVHLQQRRTLFGDNKILGDILYSDLGAEEREILELGWLTVLPIKDRSGRSVICLHPFRLSNTNHSSEARVSSLAL